jgi:hypothetical protein
MGAGLNTIVTVNPYTEGHDFTGAALVVNHLGEPDRPCEALQGSLKGFNCVTLELIRELLG